VASLLARLRNGLPVGISASWLRRILIANLVGQALIVVTGGLVRLTGSGLGCPDFPTCYGTSYIPVAQQPQGGHVYIEFANRMMTTVLTLLAAGALLAVLRYRRAGHGSRRLTVLGVLPLVGVAVQALIGGVTVLTGLNPGVVAVHFLVSMALIAVSAVLLLAAWGGDVSTGGAVPPSPALRVLGALLSGVAVVVLALGTLVTGSGPHSGDADDPNRFSFNVATVARAHSGSVWLFVVLLVAVLVLIRRQHVGGTARAGAWGLAAVTAGQGVIGYVQYALGVPIVLVALHMLGATLLVVATTVTVYPLLLRRVRATAEPAAGGQFRSLAGEDETHEALPVQR
jgi:heme a synthase